MDDETGLYYYGARYYNPELGRFMTTDALRGSINNPASLNRYAYVQNNPLKYVDPSGNAMMFPGAIGNELSGTGRVQNYIGEQISEFEERQEAGRHSLGVFLQNLGDFLQDMAPTNKESLESSVVGIVFPIKIPEKITLFRGDMIGNEAFERMMKGEPIIPKHYVNVDEYNSIVIPKLYEERLEELAIKHSRNEVSDAGLYGLSFTEDAKIAEDFAGIAGKPFEQDMPSGGMRIVIKAEFKTIDDRIIKTPYDPGKANPAFSYEKEWYVAKPVQGISLYKAEVIPPLYK